MADIAVIYNNKAKNAQQVAQYLESFTQSDLKVEIFETSPQDLEATIKKCVKAYSILLVGGGDGTIRTAAQYCAHTPTLLGVLPLGTMNHFAKELALPFDAQELIAAIKKKSTVTIDLAEVNGNIFINNSSIGFYPKFAQHRARLTKFYNKWLSYIPSLIKTFMYHKSYVLSVSINNQEKLLRTSFYMVSNNRYSYEFPLTFSRVNFTDKTLGLYYFKHGRIRFFKMIMALFKHHYFAEEATQHPVNIQVVGRKKIHVSLDGDATFLDTPLHYKSLPQSLHLIKNI